MTTTRPHRADRPCAAEIYIPGLIYIRLERFPRWLLHAALTTAGAGAGWLAARYPGLLPR
jgi:hypothetical protein